MAAADADALVEQVLAFAQQPRTSAECEQLVGHPRAWWAIKTYGPLWHASSGGPWFFGRRPSFVAAPARPGSGDLDTSARHLVRRYLEGFGPAGVNDVAQFVLFPKSRARAREILLSMADELRHYRGPDGTDLYDVPGVRLPSEDVPAPPRLMAMWDSVLLAYSDRSRVIPPDFRQHVIRRNGDVLPTVLVDGYVAGVWRAVEGGIEVCAFTPLAEEVWEALAGEACHLLGFLSEREPAVYRRYAHWWAQLPGAEVRLLIDG